MPLLLLRIVAREVPSVALQLLQAYRGWLERAGLPGVVFGIRVGSVLARTVGLGGSRFERFLRAILSVLASRSRLLDFCSVFVRSAGRRGDTPVLNLPFRDLYRFHLDICAILEPRRHYSRVTQHAFFRTLVAAHEDMPAAARWAGECLAKCGGYAHAQQQHRERCPPHCLTPQPHEHARVEVQPYGAGHNGDGLSSASAAAAKNGPTEGHG